MTTAIVKFDESQVDLIKKSIAVGASDNELKLFLYQCERTALDPFSKQIYSIKRGGKMVTQISIDGARLIAERSGRYAGQDGPYWCGDDGVWRDVWLEKKAPAAAKVNVYLMGVDRGTPGVAHWTEYSQPNSDMWKRMPALMLSKCAEMLALRKAFPMELSGLYAAEEMDQAETVQIVEASHRIVDKATGEIVNVDMDTVEELSPHKYADLIDNLTGTCAALANKMRSVHANSSGLASEKQYQYLAGEIDKLTHKGAHNAVLEVIVGRPVDSDNPCGRDLAKKLLDYILVRIKVNDVETDNPNYREDVVNCVKSIYELTREADGQLRLVAA